MYQLNELHERVTKQVTERRNQQIAESIAAKRAAAERAQGAQPQLVKSLKAAGLDVAKLEALVKERNSAADKSFQEIDAQMRKQSEEMRATDERLEVERAFLPQDAFALTPSWSALFSDHYEEEQRVSAALMPAQDVITNTSVYDVWNWASGGGWGCTGGVGENQQWVDFGFWFLPPRSGFYSVQPLFRFRGYYIVQADDAWYDCKYARTVVSAWTNAYQYTWKGWNSVNVLDVGGDNINVNNRFDTDRYTYNSYLFGGGDWVFIQATIGLFVHAKGGGSYAKNDFATGSANYVSVPWCYVF